MAVPAVGGRNSVVTAATSDATLLPLSGIALSGSGSNRTVTVTPAAGAMIVSVPLRLLSKSPTPASVIVWVVAKTVGSNVTGVPGKPFALSIASRRLVNPSAGSEMAKTSPAGE